MNFVRVSQVICLRDLAVLIGVAVEELAHFAEIVARLNGVGPILTAGVADLMLEVSVLRVYLLHDVPNSFQHYLRWNLSNEMAGTYGLIVRDIYEALSLIETDVRFLHALKDAVLSDRRRTFKQI